MMASSTNCALVEYEEEMRKKKQSRKKIIIKKMVGEYR